MSLLNSEQKLPSSLTGRAQVTGGAKEGAREGGGSLEASCCPFILPVTVLTLSNSEDALVNSPGGALLTFSLEKRGLEGIMPQNPKPPNKLFILIILKNYFGEYFASKYSKPTILLLGFNHRNDVTLKSILIDKFYSYSYHSKPQLF